VTVNGDVLLGTYFVVLSAVLLGLRTVFRRHPGLMNRLLPFEWGGPDGRDVNVKSVSRMHRASGSTSEEFGLRVLGALGVAFGVAGAVLVTLGLAGLR